MLSVFLLFLMIVLTFFILLFIKSFLKKEFCVLCLAVSITWSGFYFLYFFDVFDNLLIIAILMGQSLLGIYYLTEKKFGERLALFRLPFLLTITFIAYSAVSFSFVYSVVKLLMFLWIVFIILFLYQSNTTLQKLVNKIIACCKWG